MRIAQGGLKRMKIFQKMEQKLLNQVTLPDSIEIYLLERLLEYHKIARAFSSFHIWKLPPYEMYTPKKTQLFYSLNQGQAIIFTLGNVIGFPPRNFHRKLIFWQKFEF